MQETTAARLVEEFLSDATYMTASMDACLSARDTDFETLRIVRVLERSRLAASYIGMMKRYSGQIILNDQVETAIYDRASGNILINPNRSLCEQTLLAARELRRLWQHRSTAR